MSYWVARFLLLPIIAASVVAACQHGNATTPVVSSGRSVAPLARTAVGYPDRLADAASRGQDRRAGTAVIAQATIIDPVTPRRDALRKDGAQPTVIPVAVSRAVPTPVERALLGPRMVY